MKGRRWELAPCDEAAAARLAGELGESELFARCLLNRGCADGAEARRFLEPRLANLEDPFLLPGMGQAVARLERARAERERLVIFGDYDVDGVSATALLTQFFRALGWHPLHYLPHRFEDGYGLTQEAVDKCLEATQAKLLLAVDCGSSSGELITELAGRGVEVIVLDHHQIGTPKPAAAALVNPQLLPAGHPARALCSAGLAFKLAHALLKRGRAKGWPGAEQVDLRQWLDLAALGTIADIVPLRGENRIFARAGLDRLSQPGRAGIEALKRAAGLSGPVRSYEVSFQLAPRLNAAGRLESALDALELLLEEDAARAERLAEILDRQNRERQALEQKIAAEAIAAVRARFDPAADFAIVEGNAAWHIGVVGIVASRVQREFYRPVIILGGDGESRWRGSGRSIAGFDLAGALRECAGLLLKQGGHAMAAGVTMEAARCDEFRERLNRLARERIPTEALRPALRLDGEVSLSSLTMAEMENFARLQPTGEGNPPVQLAARGLRLKGEPRRLGANGQHLRFTVTDRRAAHRAVWWNAPAEAKFPAEFDLAFAPELNEYNGSTTIQLKTLDLRNAKTP